MARRHDTRRIKQKRTYSTNEICNLFSVGAPTVYAWFADGLVRLNRHPAIVAGRDLKSFLDSRNAPRCKLSCNEIFCVACKRPRRPDGDCAVYKPYAPTFGDLIGTCPVCQRKIYRRARKADLPIVASELNIIHEDATAHYACAGGVLAS